MTDTDNVQLGVNPAATGRAHDAATPGGHEARPVATGPMAPQPAVPAPADAVTLPRQWHAGAGSVWWVGVHGGAGESTLATLLPGSRAAHHGWPIPPDADQPVKVILVARSNVRGLTAAQQAATEWASGSIPGIDLVGLVVIADAPGKLPRPLKDLAALVGGGVPRVWHLPWDEAWRLSDVDPTSPSRSVQRLFADVRQLVPATQAAHRGFN